MGAKIYVARHELNKALGDEVAASVWGFCHRNINHSKNVQADYTIKVGGKDHNRFHFVKGYKLSTMLKMFKMRKDAGECLKSLWMSKYDDVVRVLNEIKNPAKASRELA